MGDLTGQTHGADSGSSSLQPVVGVGYNKGRHHAGELAARAGDPAHLGAAVADDIAALAVTDKINRAGHGHDGAALGGKILDELNSIVKIFLSHRVSYIGINTLGSAAAQRQRLDLRDIAADDGETDLLHQLHSGVGAQRRGTRAHGVKQNHMVQLVRLFAGAEHPLNAALVQRADVDVQAAADGGDVLDILRLIGHDGAAAAGQQNVGHIIDSDIVCDIVDQRHAFTHIFDTGTQHTKALLYK